MDEVKSLCAVGRGTPVVSGVAWRPAVQRIATRKDPFSGKTMDSPIWVPDQEHQADPPGEVYTSIVLAENAEWAEFSRTMRAHAAGFHDGIVVDLWVTLIGEEKAIPAWRPSWLNPEGDAFLMTFPDAVTERLATQDDSEASRVAIAWADTPYISEAAGSAAAAVCRCFLDLVRPLARVAHVNRGEIIVEAGGYILP